MRRQQELTQRILLRLGEAERLEPNAHYRDDYQIARLTLLHASRGDAVACSPLVLASYEVLGLHPDKVWPARVARQKAQLGADYAKWIGEESALLALPPKKPPQPVGGKARWAEKRAARAHQPAPHSVKIITGATPSMSASATQRAYDNPGAAESEKTTSLFNLIAQVRASTLAERHRNLLAAMLHENRFGTELWMETNHIAVVMGRVCYRRKKTGWSNHEKPHKLSPCERASRRTVQRLIDDLTYCDTCGASASKHGQDHAFVPRVEGGGVLDELYPANSRVPYGGGKRFRPSATYMLIREKLEPRQTSEEYRKQRDGARLRHRSTEQPKGPQPVRFVPPPPPPPTQPPPPTPPPTPTSDPEPRKAADSGASSRPPIKAVLITRDVRAAFLTMFVTLKKSGMSEDSAYVEVARQMQAKFPDLTAEQVRAELLIQSAKKLEQEEKREHFLNRESSAEFRTRKNREANEAAKRAMHRRYGGGNDGESGAGGGHD
jgi:hypothetical protein